MAMLFLHEAKNSSSIHPNTLKINICSIKLETKVLHVHKVLEYFIVLVKWFH